MSQQKIFSPRLSTELLCKKYESLKNISQGFNCVHVNCKLTDPLIIDGN